MSRLRTRRYSIQHFILPVVVNSLLVTLTVTTILWGNTTLIARSATTTVVVALKSIFVAWVGVRTVAVEIWIRPMSMSDSEYRVEPKGNDEIVEEHQALETLRQRSIEVVRAQLVEQLSTELTAGNVDLETSNSELDQALSQLREAQDQIVAQQTLRDQELIGFAAQQAVENGLKGWISAIDCEHRNIYHLNLLADIVLDNTAEGSSPARAELEALVEYTVLTEEQRATLRLNDCDPHDWLSLYAVLYCYGGVERRLDLDEYRDLQERIGRAVTAFVAETFRITGTGAGELERERQYK